MCSDFAKAILARNRLFALLGISVDRENDGFKPDYSSPLETVVQSYGATFVRKCQVRELLQQGGIASRSYRFPSWIPDYTRENLQACLDTWNTGYKAAPRSNVIPHLTSNPDELILRGWLIDSISSLSGFFTESTISMKDYFEGLEFMTQSLTRYSPRHEVLYKVPVGDLDITEYPERSSQHRFSTGLFTSYLAIRKFQNSHFSLPNHILEKDRNAIEGFQASHLEKLSREFKMTASIFHSQFYREPGEYGRFCTTRRGFIRVVRPLAELGDLICIFSGVMVPFVLRKSCEKDVVYRLIGQAYIHGIMYGEVFHDGLECFIDEKRIEPEDIVLR
jgi:hypothetical protein